MEDSAVNAPTSSISRSPIDAFPLIKGLNASDRNTLVFVCFVLATAPLLGSRTLTVGLAFAFAWTLLTFLYRRYALELNQVSGLAMAATGIYCLVKVSFTLAHSGWVGLHALQGSILFLAPIFLISYLHRIEPRRILNMSIFGCGLSALLVVPLATYQVFWIGARAEGGSGNPGVFAVLALVLGSIGALNVVSSHRSRRLLGFLSWLAMVFCVLASGMRGIWIVIPVVSGIIVWASAQWMSGKTIRRGIIAAIAFLALAIGLEGKLLWKRTALLGHDMALILEEGNYDSSTGRRLLMYEGAWQAIKEAPLSGYGIHERMNAVRAHIPDEQHGLVAYTHPHNGLLAALLDAGLAGLASLLLLLAAPVWIAAMAYRDETWRIRMAAALILTAGYVASGMTNILFEHDIMDSGFIFLLVVIAASVPRSSGPRMAGSETR